MSKIFGISDSGQADRAINIALCTNIFLVVSTIVGALYFRGISDFIYFLIDNITILGLSFGLYKKDLTASLSLLWYSSSYAILILKNPHYSWLYSDNGLDLLMIMFTVIALKGVQGCYYYNIKVNKNKSEIEKAQDKINNAWLFGIIWMIINIIISAVDHIGISANILLLAALTFGVYKKLISCAIFLLIMLFLHPLNVLTFNVFRILIIFVVFFFQGIIGIITYNKILKQSKVG